MGTLPSEKRNKHETEARSGKRKALSDWAVDLGEELHKPIRLRFRKRKVISNGIDEIWAADLVEMKKFAEENEGVKLLLTVIDVFSKFGWIETLQNKKGETVALALEKIFSKGRKPKFLWTDKGNEFCNVHVKDLLKKEGISLYSTENEEKSSVVERWNRTMKEKMWKCLPQKTLWNILTNCRIWLEITTKQNIHQL